MSANRTLRRTAAALGIATATALAALLPASAALAADDVEVSLSGLNSTQTAGDQTPDTFSVRFQNHTKQTFSNVHAAFLVEVPGLPPESVRILHNDRELARSTNSAGVVFTEDEPVSQLPLLPGRSVQPRTPYTVVFDASTPAGHGKLTAFALVNGQQMGSDASSFNLRSAVGATPSHTPSHSPSAAATVPVPLPSGAQQPVAPLNGQGRTTPLSGDGSGVPVILYILGGILVAMGGAILWMLFRRPRAAGDEPEFAMVDPTPVPPTLGYPAGPRASAPTATLPVVHEQRTGAIARPGRWPAPGSGGPGAGGPGAGGSGPGGMGGYGPAGPPRGRALDHTTAHNPRVPMNDPRTVVNNPTPGVDPWAHTADMDDPRH